MLRDLHQDQFYGTVLVRSKLKDSVITGLGYCRSQVEKRGAYVCLSSVCHPEGCAAVFMCITECWVYV